MNTVLIRVGLLYVISAWTFESTESSNILAVIPVPSKSHHYMFQVLFKELATRGHKITLITSVPLGKNVTNIEEIVIQTSAASFLKDIGFEEILALGSTPLLVPPRMSFWFFGKMLCEDYLRNELVQKLIHSERKYDLTMLEIPFAQEAFMGFSYRFSAPVVSLNSAVNFLFHDEFIGNPLSISYVPHFELPLGSPMDFYGRLRNTIRSFVILFTGYYFYLPEQEAIMRKYFNYTASENIPPLVDMLKHNISLSIVNSHISVDYVRPLAPNVIGAAGLHIQNETKALPQDLQEFMDNSKNGVIYFSLGTLVPVHRMPSAMINTFLKVFSKLKYNVLWKANDDSMSNIPSNVKVASWIPQQSILGHPNCKAFMTHGGLLSHQEAVYYGIPQIGLPVFCDQNLNVARAVSYGFGLQLNFNNITEDSLSWIINEIINNKIYKDTAIKYSKIFRDNPIPPLDNAIYWIEYVIRHKGAPHMHNAARENLNYFQYLLLDVILFIIITVLLTISLIYFLCIFLCKKIFITKIRQKNKND